MSGMTTLRFDWVPRGTQWRYNAVVATWDHSDLTLALGFSQLADTAVTRWLDAGPDDGLFAPIIYSYRHALELLLKESIRRSWRCMDATGESPTEFIYTPVGEKELTQKTDVKPQRRLKQTHNLADCAKHLEVCLGSRCFSVNGAEDPRIAVMTNDTWKVIAGMDRLDECGDAFRYTESRSPDDTTFRHSPPIPATPPGPPGAPPKLDDVDDHPGELVNVDELRNVCGKAITELAGIATALDRWAPVLEQEEQE